jgi:hypothetical protein
MVGFIMDKLTSFRYAKRIYWVFIIIGILLLLSSQIPISSLVKFLLFAFGAMFILGAFVWVFIYNKCPHCHTSLPFSGGLPEYCPSCGEKIRRR